MRTTTMLGLACWAAARPGPTSEAASSTAMERMRVIVGRLPLAVWRGRAVRSNAGLGVMSRNCIVAPLAELEEAEPVTKRDRSASPAVPGGTESHPRAWLRPQ